MRYKRLQFPVSTFHGKTPRLHRLKLTGGDAAKCNGIGPGSGIGMGGGDNVDDEECSKLRAI